MTDATIPPALATFLEPIRKYLERDGVFEVCINRPGEVFIETAQGWERAELPDLSFGHLSGLVSTISSFTKQTVNAQNPLLSCSLPAGERVQVVLPPAVPNGTVSITIRKPSTRTYTLDELFEGGLFDEVKNQQAALSYKPEAAQQLRDEDRELLELHKAGDWKSFLTAAVQGKRNVLISGSTGSGKTTLSKALIPLISTDERLITIEDTLELELPQPNIVRLVYSKGGQGDANVSARDLLEASLRMRPDRIFLQELRDASAFYYLRNVNTGHGGSITTIHADSAPLAFEQLALLVKESDAGRDLARGEIKQMLYQMIDVVMQINKLGSGKRRVTEIWFDPIRKMEVIG